MYTSRLNDSLAQVEVLLEDVSSALLSGEPSELESASATLRQAMADLSSLVQAPAVSRQLGADVRKRFEKISQLLSQQRMSLLRRAVVVDRALAVVLPQSAQQSTYSSGSKTAAYRGGAARIYASVAS